MTAEALSSAGPEGIEMLHDGGTPIEMGQLTFACTMRCVKATIVPDAALAA